MGLALRFISGKYQGGEFPLEEGRQVVVGRSSELDMVLVEEMVSRRHARLVLRDGKVDVEDLGSTNGTFVNGERVTRAAVGEGDRLLIGSNILRVVELLGDVRPADERPDSFQRRVQRRTGATSSAEARMTGNLEEIPLPDLLQLFGTSKKDGVLLVDGGLSSGKIVLRQGNIHFAQIDGANDKAEPIQPLKAVYRMLAWQSGVFELDPPSSEDYEETVDLGVQEVLMEAFRQRDEMAQYQARLPERSKALKLPHPLNGALSKLDREVLDVLQVAYNRGTVGGAMDISPLSDVRTAEVLVSLIEDGYLEVPDE